MKNKLSKVYEIPVIGPILDFVDDLAVIAAIVFVGIAGFLSYSDWVAPAYRDEAVLTALVLAVAAFVGIKLENLALYLAQRYQDPVGDAIEWVIDEGEDVVESAVGKDVIPDWAEKYAQDYARRKFDGFVAAHPPTPEVVKYIEDLKAELGKFI